MASDRIMMRLVSLCSFGETPPPLLRKGFSQNLAEPLLGFVLCVLLKILQGVARFGELETNFSYKQYVKRQK